ncbi:MAG: DUF167 domain-containing protein [Candidatus Acidiferrales bacterium]
MIEPVQKGDAVVFAVRVQPRASRDEIVGEWAGASGEPSALKVRLTAPPIDDRANVALCRLLADALGVAVSAVRIVSGERSRMKRVEVSGVRALT